MSKGKYYFTTVELKQSLKINQSSLSVSLSRLAKKGRLSASLFLSNSEKGMKRSHYELNERWNLYINTIVEPD